jgi:hypothetical protein
MPSALAEVRKESGWGREMSTEGLEAFLKKKSVFVTL